MDDAQQIGWKRIGYSEVLAREDLYQFQFWALGLVGARPADEKKGADKGIDGRLFFHDDPNNGTKQIIFSVKAGKTSVPHVRDLRGVIDREDAQTAKPHETMGKDAAFQVGAQLLLHVPRKLVR